MLYFAYGSNLNHFQMKRRCKDSKYLKKINQKSFFDLKKQKINFKIDKTIESQILISVAPGGFLKRL